jgi:hypothetical protein
VSRGRDDRRSNDGSGPAVSRRSVVAALSATLLGVGGGCATPRSPSSGDDGDSPPVRTTIDDTPSASPETDRPVGGGCLPADACSLDATVPVGDGEVAVGGVQRQASLFELTFPDSFGVRAPDGRGYVLAAVRASADVRAGDVRLVTDDDRYEGWVDAGLPVRAAVQEAHRPFDADRGRGWVAFELPAPLGGETLAVGVRGGDRSVPLPTPLVDALRRPPELAADSVDVPDRVTLGDEIVVTVRASNDGESPGVFRASVNESGGAGLFYRPNRVRLPIAAGETAATTVEVRPTERGTARVGVALPSGGELYEVSVD